jgi:hypothetical protein
LSDGTLVHAELLVGDSVVMVKDAQDDDFKALLCTYWPDVDAAWDRAVRAGAEVIYPLADQFYGERGGRLGDPFGSAPGEIRTPDLRFRRPTLYPAELRALSMFLPANQHIFRPVGDTCRRPLAGAETRQYRRVCAIEEPDGTNSYGGTEQG